MKNNKNCNKKREIYLSHSPVLEIIKWWIMNFSLYHINFRCLRCCLAPRSVTPDRKRPYINHLRWKTINAHGGFAMYSENVRLKYSFSFSGTPTLTTPTPIPSRLLLCYFSSFFFFLSLLL